MRASGCKWISRKVWEKDPVKMIKNHNLTVRTTDVIEIVHNHLIEDDEIEWLLLRSVQVAELCGHL